MVKKKVSKASDVPDLDDPTDSGDLEVQDSSETLLLRKCLDALNLLISTRNLVPIAPWEVRRMLSGEPNPYVVTGLKAELDEFLSIS